MTEEEVAQCLENARKEAENPSPAMPSAWRKYDSIRQLEEELEEGRFQLILKGLHFYCAFLKGISVHTGGSLYVFFGGYRHRKSGDVGRPIFYRWRYASFLHGAVLCMDDPMLHKYARLKLGWYYGDENIPCMYLVEEIVKAVLRHLGLKRSQVIFMGSSGGGYASLFAGTVLEGSLSVAINPQIYLDRHAYASQFRFYTGIDLLRKDVFHRNNLPQLMNKSRSTFVILFNAASREDVENHLVGFSDYLGIEPGYGATCLKNVCLWLYDCPGSPSPHVAVDNKIILNPLNSVKKRQYLSNIMPQIVPTTSR